MLPGLVAPAMHGFALLDAAAIAAGQKLPLLQREVRQLIDADEKIFRALIAVDIVFSVAVSKPRRRAVEPRDDVLRFVVLLVQLARHVAAKISDAATPPAPETCAAAAACPRPDACAPAGSPRRAAPWSFPAPPPRQTGDISRRNREIPSAEEMACRNPRSCRRFVRFGFIP